MALTGGTTTNLGLKKAAETEPYDTDWAADFNTNLDDIDAGVLLLAGGTMVGDLVTTGVSPGNAGSILKVDKVTLSNSDIKALRATPKVLVASPGSGKWLEFESITLILNAGSEALTESSDDMRVQYSVSGATASPNIDATGFIDQTSDSIIHVADIGFVAQALANVENDGLQLKNTGDGEYAGNASNPITP